MNIFTYGTLMVPEIMASVAGAVTKGMHARVNGYRRLRVAGEEYPGLIKVPDGVVDGVLYMHLSDLVLRRLDLFEGDMYYRETVIVTIEKTGQTSEAMAYLVKPEYTHCLSAEQWSLEQFLQTGKQTFFDRYFGFSELPDDTDIN